MLEYTQRNQSEISYNINILPWSTVATSTADRAFRAFNNILELKMYIKINERKRQLCDR